MEPNWTDLNESIAQAYHDASVAGADMRATSEALESIRTSLQSHRHTPFDVRASFLHQIGVADLRVLVPLLKGLQRAWERAVADTLVKGVQEHFTSSEADGWRAWLDLYTASFDERAWWVELGLQLATQALPSSPSKEWSPQRIINVTQHWLRSDWTDAYDWLKFLAKQDLPAERRGLFLALCAEIEIYQFERPLKAKAFLDQGAALQCKCSPLQRVLGEYQAFVNDFEAAKTTFRNMIEQWPDLPDGFIGLAECHRDANEWNLAESYYQQAAASAPGSAVAHSELMKWCGRKDAFEANESLIESLFPRVLALGDTPEDAFIARGRIYYDNGQYGAARNWFAKASESDAQMSRAVVGLADCAFEESEEASGDRQIALRVEAQTLYLRATELAPAAIDGYVGLASMSEDGEITDALAWYERAVQAHGGWQASARSWRASLFTDARRLDEAETEVLKALDDDSKSAHVLSELFALATAFIDQDQVDRARPLLDRWRHLKGEAGEALYQNGLGNIAFAAVDYAAAAVHYRQAVAASPSDPVLQSNLALALDDVRQPGQRLLELDEAIVALEAAARLKPQEFDYAKRLEKLSIERRFVTAYGEAALTYDPQVQPIRAELAAEIVPSVLTETEDQLSADTLAGVQDVRDRLRQRSGVTLPAVMFGILGGGNVWSNCRIVLMERDATYRTVEAGTRDETRDRVLKTISEVCEPSLDRFVGYEEAYQALAAAGPEAAQLAADRREVVRFMAVLRAILRMSGSIEQTRAIVDVYTRMQAASSEPQLIAQTYLLSAASTLSGADVSQTYHGESRRS